MCEDYGAWLYNAGVIPFTNLGTCDNVANANPVKRLPQLGGDAAQMHTMTIAGGALCRLLVRCVRVMQMVRPTSSGSFIARISERGLRVMGIPTGLSAAPVALVTPFLTRSPRCLTVQRSATQRTATWTRNCTIIPRCCTAGWYDGNTLVMEATFVYGSPYIFFEVYSGQPQIKTGPTQPQVSAVSGMKVEQPWCLDCDRRRPK